MTKQTSEEGWNATLREGNVIPPFRYNRKKVGFISKAYKELYPWQEVLYMIQKFLTELPRYMRHSNKKLKYRNEAGLYIFAFVCMYVCSSYYFDDLFAAKFYKY